MRPMESVTSASSTSRVGTPGVGVRAGRSTSLVGMVVSGTSLLRGRVTLNAITRPVVAGLGADPPGYGVAASLLRMIVWPASPGAEKSTIRSARSAGASQREVMATGTRRKPPSVPICQIGTAGNVLLGGRGGE